MQEPEASRPVTSPSEALPEEQEPAEPAAQAPFVESATSTETAADGDPSPAGAESAKGKPSTHARSRRPRDPALARAYRTGRPVEGRVEGTVKGGFEIRVGKSRAFCPFSLMDIHRVDEADEYVGRAFLFRVIQFRRGGEDIVLSRRALLEEQREDEAKAVRATLLEGAAMRGRVASLTDFGAFVDLGAGVTGLAHISELSHRRVEKAEEVVRVGEWVTVRILRLDDRKGRISLSLRKAQADPWRGVSDRYRAGDVHGARVARITDFGAFVELEPGVEALAHGRDFPPSPEGWRHGLEDGSERTWQILSVEPRRRRITVAPAVDAAAVSLSEGATVVGRVQKAERFGVFVWLAPGKVGLVPRAWTGTPKETNLATRFSTGKEIEVEVVEIADQGRRLRLAVKGAPRPPLETDKAERSGNRKKKEPSAAPLEADSSETFGTSLGDALREAMEKQRSRP